MSVEDEVIEEEIIEEEEVVEQPSPEDIAIEQAKTKGWKPFEEWEGDPKKWRPAQQFLDNESFFEHISKLKKHNKELTNTVKQISVMYKKAAEIERAKVLADLKAQKLNALENDEHEKVIKIDERIVAVQTAPIETIEVPKDIPDEVVDPEFENFKANNPWYDKDQELTEMAQEVALGYLAKQKNKNINVTPKDLYEYVDKRMQKLAPKEEKPPAVKRVNDARERTTVSGVTSRTHKFTVNDLDSEQKRIAERLVQMGTFKNKQEYVDALVKDGLM